MSQIFIPLVEKIRPDGIKSFSPALLGADLPELSEMNTLAVLMECAETLAAKMISTHGCPDCEMIKQVHQIKDGLATIRTSINVGRMLKP